ncbi:accessory Sec system S-layer assembly protein [Peribacillus saganii]|uniref:Accessory Sec system S-layer assembly protein n=1 Tax=Peribacillus saganii TaxID=2303992 RepID=A0A372LMD4_9BACI|nr:accessory Sec system S-layer assembly protein [Peribacillus saganii]RFU68314.1 accessory Sec system S-layer assembly protein [Peribacillus saganii]
MLSIFRRKNKDKLKKEGNDSTISSEELLNESEESKDEDIDTELSLHPDWDIPSEQQYVYRFLNNELEPLKPNQISLSGIELRPENNGVAVIAFVRNSLNKPIKMDDVKLLLLDSNQTPIARHTFNFAELGEIPAKSSRPWMFVFPSETLLTTDITTKDWTLAFEIKPKHRLELDESWQNSLEQEDKTKLEQLVNGLEPPKEGEVNFMGLRAVVAETGDLHVTVLIRNGSDKNIQIQQLPLEVFDATDKLIAKGGFTLDNFEVKAHTTKPWTFIFPKSLVLEETIDLSKWKVAPVQ